MEQTQIDGLVIMRPDGIPVTDSLRIAGLFKKGHKVVLQSIESGHYAEEFNRHEIKTVEYRDAKGEMRKMYELTESAAMLVTLSFTGKEAMSFKRELVWAFHEMRKTISHITPPTKVLSRQEQIMQAMCFLQEDVKALQQQNEIQQERILLQAHEAAIAAPKVDYYDEVLRSDKAITATVIAKELGMSAVTLNQTRSDSQGRQCMGSVLKVSRQGAHHL